MVSISIQIRKLLAGATLLILVLGLLCGCDVFVNSRPTAYKMSKWVCEDPDFVLFVYPDRVECALRGEPLPEGTAFCFDQGNGLHLCSSHDYSEDFFYGECSFSSEKMTVKVIQDDYFDGKYTGKTIVFKRYDLQSGDRIENRENTENRPR